MTFLDEMEASRPKRDVKWNPKIFELNFKVTEELSKSILFEKFNMGIIKRKMLISNPLTKKFRCSNTKNVRGQTLLHTVKNIKNSIFYHFFTENFFTVCCATLNFAFYVPKFLRVHILALFAKHPRIGSKTKKLCYI